MTQQLAIYSEGSYAFDPLVEGSKTEDPIHVDLFGDVFEVEEDWAPQVAREGQIEVEETIPLFAEGGKELYGPELKKLEMLFKWASRYRSDFTLKDAVWLSFNTKDGRPQRALVIRGKFSLVPGPGTDGFMADDAIKVELTVVRKPSWEWETSMASFSISALPQISGASAGYSWLGIGGTEHARLGRILVSVTSNPSPDVMQKVWLGWRYRRYGWETFDPRLELEDGTMGTDTTSQVVSGASGGSVARTVFVATTLVKRLDLSYGITYDVVNDDALSWVGKYVLLMRARTISAAATIYAEMRQGYSGTNDANFIANPPVKIESSNWLVYNMGTVRIPLQPHNVFLGTSPNAQMLALYAERVSGTGDVEWDVAWLMPADAFISFEGVDFTHISTADVYHRPDDQITLEASSASNADLATVISPRVYGVPPGDSLMYGVLERDTGHDLTDTIDISVLEVYPRSRVIYE